MRGCFDYFYTTKVNAQLTVENIGNCVIKANNDLGDTYFLLIKTKMGSTSIVEYGPYNPEIKQSHVIYLFDKLDYNEYKIEKRIEKFLTSPSRLITQAEEVNEEDIIECLVSPFVLYGGYDGSEQSNN